MRCSGRLRNTGLPRHVVQTRQAFRSPKLGKCFRDEDELAASHSLPDSIQEALAASRTLIVICSPETRESSWVRREIEMFEQLHGRERIICVLAAGSPEESILPILKTRLIPDASGVLREMPAEPLAADLRPEAKAKRKAELLRIIAAVAGCSYDDLRQRERARKRKRIALASVAAALTIAAVGRLRLPISPNQRGGAHRGIEEPRRPGARPVRPGGDRAGHRDCASSPPLFRERH